VLATVQGRLAAAGEWGLNEKRLTERAGFDAIPGRLAQPWPDLGALVSEVSAASQPVGPARPGPDTPPAADHESSSQKLCYCETVKNITVSVPDDVYRNARVAAAQRDTSVSALVVAYLEQLSGRMDEFTRLEALQREVQAGIDQFRAADRLSRDETHDRAVR
jgi:hypothetical protein